MKIKNVLLMGLSLVLVAVIAIGGTVAYLTDTDSDVNVMTLGNVKIAQHEYERVVDENGNYEKTTVTTRSGSTVDSYKVQEFTQAKPLLPATGEITGWDDTSVRWEQLTDSLIAVGGQRPLAGLNNVQDKFVLVENTGKTDAYVRTLIALEYGSNVKNIIGLTTGDFWTWNGIGIINVDGNNYYMYEAIYKGADGRHEGGVLPAGEYTYNSLGQVYLANEATNEDCEALDGNDNGTYDILVFSQAVQAQGFDDATTALDAAFGDITTTNHPWAEGNVNIPVAVATADELSAALAAGKSVYLTEDITDNRTFKVAENADVTMYLNGHTLTSMDGGSGKNYALSVSKGANLTLKGDGEIAASCYGVSVLENAKFTMDSGAIVVRGNGTYDYGVVVWNGATFVMNGGKITASVDVYASFYDKYSSTEQPTVVINDGELNTEKENKDESEPAYILTDCTPSVTINGGTFDGKAFSGNVSDYFATDTNN